jgi:hypothetical protein
VNKLEKQQAGYLYRPGARYVCGECVFLKELPSGQQGCAFFGTAVKVSASRGSCNYYTYGPAPRPDVPWLNSFTKLELGYLENENGFSCKRCEEFAIGKNDCRKVDRHSPGDNPGIISPDGCCSNWERDSVTGRASDAKLVQILTNTTRTRPVSGSLESVFHTVVR